MITIIMRTARCNSPHPSSVVPVWLPSRLEHCGKRIAANVHVGNRSSMGDTGREAQ